MSNKKTSAGLFASDAELALARSIVALAFCNPFLPERRQYERQVLGERFVEAGESWSLDTRSPATEAATNVTLVREVLHPMVHRLADSLRDKPTIPDAERELFDDLALYHLYETVSDDIQALIESEPSTRSRKAGTIFRKARAEVARTWPNGEEGLAHHGGLAHVLACFYQLRRAFHHVFSFIIGRSRASVRLRADIWQSIFSHDLRRYVRVLHKTMGDITTLVVGPSGTGKELVAQAVGRSRYIPFDAASGRFLGDMEGSFALLNLSALSPTLIESELFGHKRGSFTGAVSDRDGYLAACPKWGSVFLDEVGDLEPAIQVKLLRVLQTRIFQSIGDNRDKRFEGKAIAATNRDLSVLIAQGRFRADLYYRLCADTIRTPSLTEQIGGHPVELERFVRFLARRLLGDEADTVTGDVMACIEKDLGLDYAWPGNVRELEQCVRQVVIRKTYSPIEQPSAGDEVSRLAEDVRSRALSLEALNTRYVRLVHRDSGSYLAAAKKLGVDRRTVKTLVDKGRESGLY
ncbi:MAG: sigma-54-dependent Fis family transcriptional regulator [Phycisphaera sp.]|nr:sigma-54-dependent Fis family transcriptional regulator [Phycisphaera sp.]